MQSKLWRLAASVIVVTGLTACSSLSGMTDKVSQTWDKTWTGLTGKKQAQAQTEVGRRATAQCGDECPPPHVREETSARSLSCHRHSPAREVQ